MTAAGEKSDRLHELVRVLLDEEISDSELRELAELLRDDPAAIGRYLDYMSLDAELAWECSRASLPLAENPALVEHGAAATKTPPRRRSRTAWAVLAAAAVVAIITLVVFLSGQEENPIAANDLTLEHVAGDVLIGNDDDEPLNLEVGMRLSANVTVSTRGPTSFARLVYGDGSRILVAGDSVALFSGLDQKILETQRGTISASVSPQPAGRPLLVTTQQARLEVLGTEFSLTASADETDLQVAEGSVKLTRVADGETIVVPEGKRVEADVFLSDLVVRDAPPPADSWEEDFETGLPGAWLSGAFVNTGLPPGSQGAVKAALDSQTQVYGVTSPHPWMHGLFIVHADTHLHVTYKMARPDWINLFFITRTSDPGDPTTFLHKFNRLPTAPADAERWRTVTIPLHDFQRKSARGFEDAPPKVGELVFGISCNSPAPDRALVIDRIWITRGGPGRVVAKDAD